MSGQASPRDNVVFEAGLFGGALGMRRTFILHANGAKLPTDLLGLTCVRYDPADRPGGGRAINQKLRNAIEAEGRRGAIEGLWWQLSLTARSEHEPSAVSLLRISRDRDGSLTSTAGPGRRTAPCPALLERGCGRSARIRPASSTTGKASGPATRCPAARGNRRDPWTPPTGERVLDDPVGSRPRVERPDLPASTSGPGPSRPAGAGGRQRGKSGPS